MIDFQRRQFIQRVGTLGIGTCLGLIQLDCKKSGLSVSSAQGGLNGKPGIIVPQNLKTLTSSEFRTVAEAAERILPRDEHPGAIDLGVAEYIDFALAQANEPNFKRPFMGGLQVLDRQAKSRMGAFFSELVVEKQDQLLSLWQKGASGEKRFFETLFIMTLEGAFGDPTYGGNKKGKGFQLIGFFPGPPMPGMSMIDASETLP